MSFEDTRKVFYTSNEITSDSTNCMRFDAPLFENKQYIDCVTYDFLKENNYTNDSKIYNHYDNGDFLQNFYKL